MAFHRSNCSWQSMDLIVRRLGKEQIEAQLCSHRFMINYIREPYIIMLKLIIEFLNHYFGTLGLTKNKVHAFDKY